MGTLAAAGTSNSKTATEPPEASPSSRNRIANCPILISCLGLVAMRTSPVLGCTYSNSRKPSLPYARRSIRRCQSTPRGGKHYQHNDDDCHYRQHCASDLYSSVWSQDYPRRSQKEVDHTNDYRSPQAPRF